MAGKDDNSQHWKVRILTELQDTDVWEVITGEEVQPPSTITALPPPTGEGEQAGTETVPNTERITKWGQNVKVASKITVRALGPVPSNGFYKYADEAQRVWDTPESRYAQLHCKRRRKTLICVCC